MLNTNEKCAVINHLMVTPFLGCWWQGMSRSGLTLPASAWQAQSSLVVSHPCTSHCYWGQLSFALSWGIVREGEIPRETWDLWPSIPGSHFKRKNSRRIKLPSIYYRNTPKLHTRAGRKKEVREREGYITCLEWWIREFLESRNGWSVQMLGATSGLPIHS